MTDQKELKAQLTAALSLRQAHAAFEDAVADFPEDRMNVKPPNRDYSFWHLLEHIRLAQKDILDYIISDEYTWGKFPDDYWPDKSGSIDKKGWSQTVEAILADRQQLVAIVNDPKTDLFAELPNSGAHKHTLLREILIIASHNAYHTGAFLMMRKVLGF